MPVYYGLGDALVTDEELIEKRVSGDLNNFVRGLAETPQEDVKLELSTGLVTRANLVREVTWPFGDTTEFEPVGVGKPLTIEIRHIYTGKYPKSRSFGRGGQRSNQDMLVTSAMKSIATFDAAPRAVNFLTKNVAAGTNLSNPSATESGTPLVHYSPAMAQKNSILTIEFGFDEFPDETFNIVGNALSQAAGIPIFLSAGAHLLAAGAITKVLGKVGSIFFDSSPLFKADVALEFERPGGEVPTADFRLVTAEEWDKRELARYSITASGLRDSNGQPYDGERPYTVLSLDGRKQQEYEDFSPTAASAAMLEKFFDMGDGQELTLEPLIDAIKLYNDWTFRQKADRAHEELEDLEEGTDQYTKKKTEYEAFVKNIMSDLLKPND